MGSSLKGKRGSAALVAVSMFVLLGIGALAVDLGMLMKVRAEAQRTADAAALAGASAFMTKVGAEAVPDAFDFALQWAAQNQVQAIYVDTTGGAGRSGLVDDRNEVVVQVIPDSVKVRVWVRRANISTFLARVFGIYSWDVNAKAAAEASPAGYAETCVKPFLIPDYWGELTGEDLNTNRVWEIPPDKDFKCGTDAECWGFSPGDGDTYAQYQDTVVTDPTQWTGLGTDYRNAAQEDGVHKYHRDYGRPIMMYPDGPKAAPVPSNFWLWRIECPGGDCVREALNSCNTLDATVGEMIAAEEPGLTFGPVAQGVNDWMAQDETARWVEGTPDANGFYHGNVESDLPGKDGLANPRVFVAALMRPEFMAPGYDEVPVLNLARFFLEDGPRSASDKKNIKVRFMGFASGLGPENPDLGTLVRVLRLVE